MSYIGEVRVLWIKLISCILKQLIGHQALVTAMSLVSHAYSTTRIFD